MAVTIRDYAGLAYTRGMRTLLPSTTGDGHGTSCIYRCLVLAPTWDGQLSRSLRDEGSRRTRRACSRVRGMALTPTQYRAAIAKLGLSQERAGLWLGIGKRTSQGYALGERPVPEPVAKLLRLMVRLKLQPDDVN